MFFQSILTIFPKTGDTFFRTAQSNMATATASSKFSGTENQDLAPGTMNKYQHFMGSNLRTALDFLGELTFCTLPRETHSNSEVPSPNVESIKGIKHFAISKH